MKLSRRDLIALAGAGAAITTAAAQTPAQTPATTDPLAKARERNSRSSEALSKFEIPMSTEPAFVFRA